MKPPDSYNGGNYVKYVLLHCDAQHDDDETIYYVFVHLKFEKICVIMKKFKILWQTYLEPCQKFMMELFEKIFNNQKALIFLHVSSVMNFWQGSKYAFLQ